MGILVWVPLTIRGSHVLGGVPEISLGEILGDQSYQPKLQVLEVVKSVTVRSFLLISQGFSSILVNMQQKSIPVCVCVCFFVLFFVFWFCESFVRYSECPLGKTLRKQQKR